MAGELDPASELRLLTEALRAHAEWHRACGAIALPPAPERSHVTAAAPLSAPLPPLVSLPGAEAALSVAEKRRPPEGAGESLDERRQKLTVLASTVQACTRCALHQGRTQTVFARGSGASGLCFVGEGPGADEDLQGFPFVGAAGQLLDKMIAAMGIERDDVYVCNIVKCRPPKNRAPEPEEMSACMPYLVEQLALVEPQVIVALGKTAVQGLFGTAEGITRIRGRWRLYQGRIAVMPTFHPAYLLRNPEAKRDVWADLQLVLKHMGRAVPGKG